MQQLGRAGPNAMVSDISIMTAQDLTQVWGWNRKVPDTVDRCIHDVISEQARMRPEAVAVCACDGQLTYAELDKLASELASYLINWRGKNNSPEETFVPLCFDKSLWTPVAMLGVLKSGAAFVLLDPSLPEQRLKHIVDKVGGEDLILASDSRAMLGGRLSNQVVTFNWGLFTQASPARTSHLPHASPGTAAYTLSTSGSTGTPKGVVITHRNLSSALPCHVKGLGYTPESRVYDFASYSFGASLNNMFAALTSGACLCIPSDHDRRSQLDRSLVSMGATHVLLTPSVAESLSPKNVSGLQSIIFGGEAVRPQDVLPWWETGVKVRIAYGSSECTTISTINDTASTPQQATRIGKGVGLVPWIVHPTDHNRLLPPGCIGELLLEGPGVGREYLSDLEKTAEAFIQDPTWLLQGEKRANEDEDNLQPGRSGRLYKTGDLVCYNQDGSLSFFGRKDSQVKIRGQRVELGEVEHWVKECVPEATQAVVEAIVPTRSDSSHQTLAAFFVMNNTNQQEQVDGDDNKPTIFPISTQIQEALSRHLPSYMVPTVFISMKKLPMTATGKMNRRAIRQLGGSFSAQQLAKARQGRERQVASDQDQQPSTSIQREMQRIWARILDLPISTIGLDDGFFSLGGDSIASMKVVGEARKAGIELAVADIFTYRTLREISDHSKRIATRGVTREDTSSEIPPFSLLGDGVDVQALCQTISAQCEIAAAKVQDAYPCTPLQEGLMTLASKRPGDYVMQAVLELSSDVSIGRFQRAWEEAVEAIAVLRTRIIDCDGFEKVGLLQVVLDDKVNWTGATHLDTFLQADRGRVMVLNEPLSRYALVSEDDASGPRWFVWTVSHTIYDGWSVPLIFHAVEKAYQARTEGNSKPLEKAPGFQHFIKYLEKQHKSSDGSRKTEQYWRGYFDSSEATLFPTLPSPMYQPVSNQTIQSRMTLKAQSSLNIAPSTLIRAAWALVAGQMTNSSDVVFGITVSGRNAPVPNIEAMPGPSIATVPQRITWDADQTVSDYLEKVQRDSTHMIPYEHTGMHRIAKISPNARQACQFQTLLIIQSQTERSKGSNNTHQSKFGHSLFGKWEEQDQSEWFSSHPLIIQAHLGAYNGNDWAIDVTFDPNVIEEWLMYKLVQRLELVMQSFMAECQRQGGSSEKTIQELSGSIMTDDDLEQLWAWNQSAPLAVDECVHTLIERRVLQQPDALAVDAWDGSLTYLELDRLADRVATKLLSVDGINCQSLKSKLIPLHFEKSKWTSVVMLGVLKAGGAFVLLDSSLPEQRLKTIVDQVGPDMVVSSVSNGKRASRLCPRVVEIGPKLCTDTDASVSLLAQTSTPSSPMYSIFTSGSTGTPKGIIISHSNFASEVKHQSEILGLSKTSRFFDFSSYAFDASVQCALASFINGGCICVPSDQDRKDNISEVMVSMKVDTVFLTPTVARLLNPATLPDVKTIIIGGEAVSADDAARWLGGKTRFVNAYGPSECTIMSTFNDSPSSPEDATSIGFGAGLVTWIADSDNHDRLLPPGCIGELLLEGPLVGQGYLNDPTKTAAAFIEDPPWLLQGSSTRPGRRGRMYKSGDLVQYRRDGSLCYVGRKDAQVKIRGQRIELEEVSRQVQASWPDSGACQVAAEVINPQGEGSRPMLAAFIIPNGNSDGREEPRLPDNGPAEQAVKLISINPELEATLAERLPAAMIPSAFFYYMGRQLPQTTTGKTNRKILREIGSSFSVQKLAEVGSTLQGSGRDTKNKRQPTTPVEREMQVIWARILGIKPDQVGMDDSFLRLGGDSIAAMKVSGEARKKLGLEITVADLLRRPKLCDIITASTSNSGRTNGGSFGHADHQEIPHNEYSGPVEQSYAQSRLWFMNRLYPGLNWYFIPFTARLRGPLQAGALRTALQALESRHETLRTTFLSRDDLDLQVIEPFAPRELKIIELPWGDEGEERLQRALEVQRTTPLNLSTEPGWRVTLYQFGSEQDQHYMLSILMHHIISDGWSINVLLRELADFYTSAVKGLDPLSQIDPLPIQYRDYALWQKQPIRQDEYQKQLEYWTLQLQTSRPAEFLCDKPRPATLSGEAGVVEFAVEGPLYSKAQKFCQDNHVTPFVALLAAFRATHYRMTGAPNATIGTANANRDRYELKELIGFFVNLQCLRVDMEQSASFNDLVQHVQKTASASFDNQDVPFERIVSQLNRQRDLSRHPLVQVVFSLHSQGTLGALELGEDLQSELIDPPPTTRFDLEFHILDEGSSWRANIIYSKDLYEPEIVNSIASVFNSILKQALNEPSAPIASLPLLTDTDRDNVNSMGLINIERDDYPRDSSVVDLFKEQVSLYPDRIAVKDNSTQFTYAELDHKSDVVARWILQQHSSFKSESLIAVMASRSCEAIITIFGILKAGMAYVPFNHSTPAGRVEAILSTIKDQQRLLLLGHGVSEPAMGLHDVQMVRISTILEDETPQTPMKVLLPRVSATNLANVIFTSGSTGQPKGVMVEHRGISRLAKNSRVLCHLPPSGATAHQMNLSFDGSTLEIYGSLLNGLTMVCIDEMTALDALMLQKVFEENDIRTVIFTPAVLKQILRENPRTLGNLEMLCVGGDRLDRSDCIKAHEFTAEGARVINLYGPTENTVVSTKFCYEGDKESLSNGSVPIGQAISNSGALVMDSQQRIVPLGVVGELALTGDGLARGYTDHLREFDTCCALKELEDGNGKSFQRAYRTGDYARWRPVDGQIEFMGRMDVQVKIRGHRVEAGEVEHAIRKHEAVNDAVVLVHRGKDGNDEAQLVGFVTLHDTSSVMISNKNVEDEQWEEQTKNRVQQDLDAKLRANLPTYMIPQSITLLDRMPMNASGKVDRAALSRHIVSETNPKSSRDTELLRKPRSEVEKTMQKIWGDVLGMEPDDIGLDDNFFHIGGHSISAMRVVTEARKENIALAVVDIFRSKSLEDLARIQETSVTQTMAEATTHEATEQEPLIDQDTKTALWEELDSLGAHIQSTEVEDILPITSMQELYVTQGPAAPGYAHYFYLDLGSKLDISRIKESCLLTLERIPILRASFVGLLGKHWQVIPRHVPAELQMAQDIEVEESLDQATEAFCLHNWESISPIGPIAQFTILRHKDEGARLVIRLSHAQYDGVCFPVIVRSLIDGYTGADVAMPSPGFAEFLSHSARQRPQSIAYWTELLRGSSVTNILPKLRLSNTRQTTKLPQRIVVEANVALPDDLPHAVTPATVASAAWAVLLSHITGENDLVYAHSVAGRNSDIPRLEEIVGPCVNVIPIRATLDDSSSPAQLLETLQHQFLSLGSADSLGFKDILRECTDWPAGSEFESFLHHANVEEHPDFDFAGTRTRLSHFTNPRLGASQLMLASFPNKRGDHMQFQLNAMTDMLSEHQSRSLLDGLCKIIHLFGENLNSPISSWKGGVVLNI
ncbi:non-ribosomal peptide synthetase [Fusarium albosuccineum]|uniref:Non-ribosomal peptide synthetase n=1 Tax=Fusarium albosuccineum TaxID=1237068 RepID=A0A8H4L900_9HYPO|nr:non-ribosomal peptide synthetase [Fusarium albosuccineum]